MSELWTGGLWARTGAWLYDPFLSWGERAGMRDLRASLLAGARGRTLEIGAGSGLNVPHYPDAVSELVLAEPVEPMARQLRRRARAAGRPTEIVAAPAESLPFESGRFDTVVSTLVLCTVADPGAAIAEVERVLAPGGRLLFCEHVLSDTPALARWQRRLAGPWERFAQGCRCDRETLATIAGRLRLGEVSPARWRRMPAIVHPLVVGEAVRPDQPVARGWARK